MKPEVQYENSKVRWPEGWNRTLIELRKSENRWTKPLDYYRANVAKELERMGATSVLITHGAISQERLDPGVAVWFSMVKEDYGWQTLLGLGPAPRLEEIDQAFRDRVKPVHPDRTDGGDVEMFKRLVAARNNARAWVLGTHTERHEYVLALDRYSTVKGNLAGLKLAFANFRSLERLGMPSILERVLDKALKAALPMHATEGKSDAA